MSSLLDVPPGPPPAPDLIRPAHLWVPPRAGSLGQDAVDLASAVGLELDPEQELAVDAICSIRADGRWAALENAVIEPRQNGKSDGILLPAALLAAIGTADQLVVWSAHRYKTSHESFLALLKLHDASPSLQRKTRKIALSNGEESFTFDNGSRLVFLARSRASGRGLSGDFVVLDEALFLDQAMMGALIPTMSARPNPMVLYGSSAGFASSDVLADLRDRGRAGSDPSLVWVEWCAPAAACADGDCDHHRGAVGCSMDDPAYWRAANPSVGRRMSLDFIMAERRAMTPAEFGRERLGWWESKARGGLFHMPSWWKLTDPASTPGEALTLAVHVTPDRGHSAIGIASLRGDGVMHLELIKHAPGVSWVLPYVTQRVEMHNIGATVLAGAMAAGPLAPDLESLPGFRALSSVDVRRACASFFDGVAAGEFAHAPHPDLDAAVQAAGRSSGRGEWVFDADPDIDLSPLYAVALAAWAARTEAAVTEVSIFNFADLGGNCLDCDCEAELYGPDACKDCGHVHDDEPNPDDY